MTIMPSRKPKRTETPEPVVAEMDAATRRGGQGGASGSSNMHGGMRGRGGHGEGMVVQGDFRKVSGISSEIFNQIQAVENDHDAATAASLAAVEKRGEMVVRALDPRSLPRTGRHHRPTYPANIRFVEIIKRPGQTLGLYLREGNFDDRSDGVFVSRIALESAVYDSGVLKVGDEILAVNLVDVTAMSLDDVVIIMSIPRRLVLTIRPGRQGIRSAPMMKPVETKGPPVVIVKKELIEEEETSTSENGQLFDRKMNHDRIRKNGEPESDQCLFYNSQPGPKFKQRPLPPPPLPRPLCQKPEPRAQTLPPKCGHVHQSKEPKRSHYYCKKADDVDEQKTHQRFSHKKSVVTDQPKAQFQTTSFPKTLESLAEKVHTFYSGPRLLDTRGQPIPGSIHASSSEKCLNLIPRGERGGSGGTLPRGSGREKPEYGRLLRAGSEHMIPTSYSQTLRSERNLETRAGRYDTVHRMGSGVMKTRRRAPCESFSDTEAGNTPMPRPSILSRQRSYIEPGAVSAARYSFNRANGNDQQTKSLPRMRASADYGARSRGRGSSSTGTGRHKYSVRFERDTYTLNDSQDESDGAVSAPEMPSWKSDRRQKGRIPHSPSVFTAAEYKDWLKRTPSTSAIYEQLKRSREVLNQQRASRLTFSAECLLDEAKKEEDRLHMSRTASSARKSASSRLAQLQSLPSSRLSAATRARMMEARRAIPTPSPATRPGTAASDSRLRLLDIEPDDFIKYKPESVLEKTTTSTPVSGLLLVNLLAGRGLRQSVAPSPRHQPYRDLYCVLECDRVHKARTVVRMGDHNFDWDETFELDLIDNRELDFLVYSWDPKFRHKLCYKASIDIAILFETTFFHQLALKLEPRGTIYLKLRYTNPLKAFQRNPAPVSKLTSRRPALFGVDIEATVSRENSGFNVPIVIKRCIDEIERRGLDIIGLYRLCGSATKKRTLRDSFERNPRLVDLTPDNVPDINVITGILKDYLRELPEPLLPKALYQMLVDAMTVCLPDDPEGNAKLIFSILDCLPKFNKCTLIMVVDHFKLVLEEKEKNKMTAHSLASCFGPLLMCKSEENVSSLDLQQPNQVMKYLLEIWPSKNESSSGNGGIDHLTVTSTIGAHQTTSDTVETN